MEGDLDLVRSWLGESAAIPVIDEASVSLVREQVRAQAARVGLDLDATAAIVDVASELAHNHLAHARGGYMVTREARRGEQRGVEVVAADGGEGIRDVAGALEGRRSRPESLGVGLAAVFELADEVDMDVRLLEGTCVWARKFGGAAPRRRRVGVYGRPCPGETCSGDDAAFVREGDVLTFGVADGLGHGESAREASTRAVRLLAWDPRPTPSELLAACDRSLRGTRGAVMTAAMLSASGEFSVAGIGNVAARVYGVGPAWRFGGSSFVLGSTGSLPRITTEDYRLDGRDVLLLFTDGIRSSLDLGGDFDLLREHPVIIAQRVVERFAREDDDVLVMAVS
ncbi:MAG TPA: SpoIIE family protein phosphatase [Polyangiaceae bacterium]|nr:SpoIIE family protein phosphatase [Polyangiaceae bacterium]